MTMNKPLMSKAHATAWTNSFSREAMASGPHDRFTIVAIGLRTILNFVLMIPTFILMMPSALILGFLPFRVLLVPLGLLWTPFFGFIFGSSWLWIKVPKSRPLLLIPGVLVSSVAKIYAALVPDIVGETYPKQLKMTLCDTWPYSYLVWGISLHYRDAGVLNPTIDQDLPLEYSVSQDILVSVVSELKVLQARPAVAE